MSYVSRDLPAPHFAPQTTRPKPVTAIWPVIWSVIMALAIVLLVSMDHGFSAAALASMGP